MESPVRLTAGSPLSSSTERLGTVSVDFKQNNGGLDTECNSEEEDRKDEAETREEPETSVKDESVVSAHDRDAIHYLAASEAFEQLGLPNDTKVIRYVLSVNLNEMLY